MDIWMLIVEENKEFTEFGSASISRMCRLHSEIELLVFLSVFLRSSFSKCSLKMLAITGEIGEPIAAPEVCSKIKLVAIGEVSDC